MTDLCAICAQAPSKYKCPTCFLAYCSLPCFKNHKQSHEGNGAQTTQVEEAVLQTAQISLSAPKKPLTPSSKTAEETAGYLRDTNGFQELLSRYPTLRTDLQHLYEIMTEPPENRASESTMANGSYGTHRIRNGKSGPAPWNPRRGEAQALRALRQKLGARETANGQAVSAFMELVESTRAHNG